MDGYGRAAADGYHRFPVFTPFRRRNSQKTIRRLDICGLYCYNPRNFIETVEAEIKAAMPSQRARKGESRAGNKPPNGPRRAQSKAKAEYSAT